MYYQPGSFGPPIPPPRPTKPYSHTLLYVFIGVSALFWLLALLSQGQGPLYSIAICLFLGLIVSLLILDAHGLVTLANWLSPRRNKVLFGLLMVFTLPIWTSIYLLRSYLAFKRPPLASAPVRRKAVMALTIGIATMLFFGVAAVAASSPSPSTASIAAPTTPVQQFAQVVTATPTIRPTPIPTPTPAPRPVPTATPTPVPPQQPTQPPPAPQATQPPAPIQPLTKTGIYNNPYGYDLNSAGGSLIYNPPADLCTYLPCIANFPNGRGYVEECQDGMFSKSGGIQGSCSHHQGDKQPLYAH